MASTQIKCQICKSTFLDCFGEQDDWFEDDGSFYQAPAGRMACRDCGHRFIHHWETANYVGDEDALLHYEVKPLCKRTRRFKYEEVHHLIRSIRYLKRRIRAEKVPVIRAGMNKQLDALEERLHTQYPADLRVVVQYHVDCHRSSHPIRNSRGRLMAHSANEVPLPLPIVGAPLYKCGNCYGVPEFLESPEL